MKKKAAPGSGTSKKLSKKESLKLPLGVKPVLEYCPQMMELIPKIYRGHNADGQEIYVDIAELSHKSSFIRKFEKKYPAAHKMFLLDRSGMREWLYKNYKNISI